MCLGRVVSKGESATVLSEQRHFWGYLGGRLEARRLGRRLGQWSKSGRVRPELHLQTRGQGGGCKAEPGWRGWGWVGGQDWRRRAGREEVKRVPECPAHSNKVMSRDLAIGK